MDSVFHAFCATAGRRPDAPFLCIPAREGRDYCPEGAEFSYSGIAQRAIALARVYAEAGFGHGHRVALLLENRPEFFDHFLALNSLGVSIVPVNPDYVHNELVYQLDHSDAALVVALSSRVEGMQQAAQESALRPKVLDVAHAMTAMPKPVLPIPLEDSLGPQTECAMLYTSGTTGRPKGCILSNYYFLNAGEWYLSMGGRAEMRPNEERVFNPLPLYHMNALAVTGTGMMLSGGCLISPDRFHPSTWWQDVCDTDATVIHYLGVVPPLLLNLPPSDVEKTHKVRFGFGAGVDPKHHAAFESRFGFPLVEVWGMTETGRIFGDVNEPRAVGSRAFGKPLVGLDARVVDRDDNDVSANEPGELLVRHNEDEPRHGFFSGYYKNEEATEEAWRGGWFHTGDTVRQDEGGMLYFIDRTKNIIRRSGENIAAAEIEATLQVRDDVSQAAVISVPDDLREEEVFACIVLADGLAGTQEQAEVLFEHCIENLAYFKAPGYMLFVDTLPTTGTQKVQKTQLFAAGVDPRLEAGCIDLRDAKSQARKRQTR